MGEQTGVENRMAKGARREEKGRPIIGGGGADPDRQAQLDQTLGRPPLEPHVVKANKLLDKGSISVETFWERVFKKRNV